MDGALGVWASAIPLSYVRRPAGGSSSPPRPELERNREQPVPLPQCNHLTDIVRLLNPPGEERFSQRFDLIAIQLAHGIAQELGRCARKGLESVSCEPLENDGLVVVVHDLSLTKSACP